MYDLEKDLENVAIIEHEQWMKWSKELAEKENLSSERTQRWKTECWKPYAELSEEMKEHDRVWARAALNASTAVQELKEAQGRIHNAKEVFIGMEGFIPRTAPEAYCLQILADMYKELIPLNKRINHERARRKITRGAR